MILNFSVASAYAGFCFRSFLWIFMILFVANVLLYALIKWSPLKIKAVIISSVVLSILITLFALYTSFEIGTDILSQSFNVYDYLIDKVFKPNT